MKFKTLSGKLVFKNCSRFRIDWNKQEKSKIQTKVKEFLRPYLQNHVVYSEFPVFGTLLKIDIFDATTLTAYEVDGRQHESYNKFFHNNSRLNYLDSIKRDVKKEKWLEMNNITLIRINEDEVKNISKQWFEERGIYL